MSLGNPYNKTTTQQSLVLSGLTASTLVATDANKQLTSAVTGLSPTFTGLTLSGLSASGLVATTAGKALTSTVSGLSPTFTALSVGTGELTCGSINRASGTLTLEIGGGAEVSITSTTTTLGGNLIIPDGGTIGSASDTDVMTIDASGNTTFSVFPITPSAAPDADYEVANKKYVDDEVSGLSLGGTFVDRGDASAKDYAVGDLTLDSSWRDLDLSSVVPAGAKAVLLAVETFHTTVAKVFQLRENGDTNGINVAYITSPVASQYAYEHSTIVACDANRVIEYWGEAGFTAVNITIRGWWT